VADLGSPDALLRRLFSAALVRVAPAGPTARALAALDLAGSIVLLATGKASRAMAAGAETALGERIAERIVVAPAGTGGGVIEGAHPVPDHRSEAAGRALLAAAARARPDQDLVALVSGGGSALSAVPADGLALADKAAAIARLMAAGAPIAELNCVRRHLSAIKGGRLASASPARVTTLVVSDVVGDALHEVASGPTVPDPTGFGDAGRVVERWIGWHALPPKVARHLDAGRRGHLRPLAPRPRDRAMLVLGLAALVDAAAEEARSHLDRVEVLPDRLEGRVEDVARMLAGQIIGYGSGSPRLLIAGGEPTVSLPERPGRSGRAQHLALLLARDLARAQAAATILVAGSDGVDGTSDAAGAVVDRDTWSRIEGAGLDPGNSLASFDAAAALAAAGAQIVTGPTGVNHADLVLAFAGESVEGSTRR
jgi:glycerate 2-kinase